MFVYFIRAGDSGPVKIGRAKRVEKRLETLQTGNHEELYVVAAIRCDSQGHAMEIERKLHKLFRRQHIRGEWFNGKIKLEKATQYLKDAAAGRRENRKSKHERKADIRRGL